MEYLTLLWTSPAGWMTLLGLGIALLLTTGLVMDTDPHPVRKARRDWARARAWWDLHRALAQARRTPPPAALPPLPLHAPAPPGPRIPAQRRRHARED